MISLENTDAFESTLEAKASDKVMCTKNYGDSPAAEPIAPLIDCLTEVNWKQFGLITLLAFQ